MYRPVELEELANEEFDRILALESKMNRAKVLAR
jgi:hypothetical protein